MESQNVEQEAQTSPEAVDHSADNHPRQFDSMSPDELKDYALKLSSQIHKVNEESKARKIKLRELETEKLQREQKLLEEQGKYKELYESTLNELESLRPLKDFKEQHDKLQEQRLGELEKQLTKAEREELSIFDDLTTEKKVRWMELKIKNRTSINLDVTSSTHSGGSLRKLPQNRRELATLTTEEQLKFKQSYPDQYKVALNTL